MRRKIGLFFIIAVLALTCGTVLACSKVQVNKDGKDKTYTVTYYYNYDGAPNGGVYRTDKVEENTAAQKPTNPTRDNYTFSEWTTDKAGSNRYVFSSLVTSDVPLYAQWTENPVSATLTGIEVTHAPNKTVYTVGEELELDGLVVMASYSEGEDKQITVTADMLSDYDMDVAGTYNVKISYTENSVTKTDTFEITVNPEESVLTGIEVTHAPNKTVYKVGEELVLDGLVVMASYSEGEDKQITVTADMLSDYDMDVAGTYNVKISYTENSVTKTDTFEITVNPAVDYVKVTFSKGTDYDVSGMPGQQTLEKNETAEEPLAPPVCKGFTFDGWYTVGGTKWQFDTAVDEDIELVAHWVAKTYSVKYIVENGADPQDGSYTATAGVFNPFTLAVPQEAHYTFDGWYLSNTYTGTKYTELTYADITSAEEFVLYGKFTAETYDIEYVFGGSADTYSATWAQGFTPETSYSYGDTVELPVAENIVITSADPSVTYRFAGWTVDGETVGDISATDFGSKVFVANITSNPVYVVTYDHNYDGGPTETRDVEKDGVAPNLTPTREGYTFAGWYHDEECDNPYDFNSETITGPITLYADWTIDQYTVTFDPNGGTMLETERTQEVEYNSYAEEPQDPTLEGHEFLGWFTDLSSDTAYDFDTPVKGALKLYAKWEKEKYTVTFDPQGGTMPEAELEQTVEYNNLVDVPTTPKLAGYSFDGWYNNDTKWNFAEHKVTGSITLTAKWSVITYTVQYFVGEGANGENKTTYKITDEEFTLLAATAPVNFYFVEWRTAAENGDLIEKLDSEIIDYADDKNVIKLYAIYSDIYTVTFDANQGTLADGTKPQSVQYGKLITAPDAPTRTGYTFRGWKLQDSEAMWDFKQDKMPAENITLYAVWRENPKNDWYLRITYDNWDTFDTVLATEGSGYGNTEYTVNSITLAKGAIFYVAYYDASGTITKEVKPSGASMTTYRNPGQLTATDINFGTVKSGSVYFYTVSTLSDEVSDLTWKLYIQTGQVTAELISSGSRYPDNTPNSSGEWTEGNGTVFFKGGFNGWSDSEAWSDKSDKMNTVVNGKKYYFTKVYLEIFDQFKMFNGTWYGMSSGSLVVGSAGNTLTDNGSAGNILFRNKSGFYDIVFDLSSSTTAPKLYIYEHSDVTVTCKQETVYIGDTLTVSDFTASVGSVSYVESNEAVSGLNTVKVVCGNTVVYYTYTATELVATGVELVTQPTKRNYEVGDSVVLDGIVVKVTYNKPNTTENVSGNKLTADITRFVEAGTKTVTVTLNGTELTVTFDVTVTDKLTSIAITTQPKTQYYEDDTELDLSEMVVTAHYNEEIDGAQVVSKQVTEYSTNAASITFTAGTKKLVVSYGGKTAETNITVSALEITELAVDKSAAKTEYKLGETFSSAGLKITATYNSGKSKEVALGEFTFSAGLSDMNAGILVRAKEAVTITATHTASSKTATFTVKVNPLTVVYSANGGTLEGNATVTITGYGDTLTEAEAPTATRDYYNFVEWQYKGAEWDFATGVTEDMTLLAKWAPKTYDITFELGGMENEYTVDWKDGSAPFTSYTYSVGVTLPDASKIIVTTLTDDAAVKYNFLGWYVKDGVKTEHVTSISATDFGDKIFVAHIEKADTVEFTFDLNYDGLKEEINVVKGTPATKISDPTRTGYTFGGWYNTAECNDGDTYNFEDAVDEATTVYAKWTINSHTVTFDYGYDNLQSTRDNVNYGTLISEPANMTRDGYTLDGWYYGDKKWIFAEDTMPDEAITLVAHWNINKYTVTFESNGGSDVAEITEVPYDTTITAPTAPTKKGYEFAGWYKDSGLSTEWVFETDKVTDNTTLYAKWDIITYTVEYYVDGSKDNTAGNATEYKITDGTVTLVNPEKTGYDFDGWYTDATYSGDKITELTYEELFAGVNSKNAVPLYGRFTIKKISVTFDLNYTGAPAGTVVKVDYGTRVPEASIPEPERDGYEFKGWYTDKDCTTGKEWKSDSAITEPTTVYAKWEQDVKVNGLYVGNTLLKAFVVQTENEEYAAKNVKIEASASNPIEIRIFVDNVAQTEAVTIKSGSASGFTASNGIITAKASGIFTIYYAYAGNNQGVYVSKEGDLDIYVEPELQSGDGIYVGSTLIKEFAVNDNSLNQIMATGVKITTSSDTELATVTLKYKGETAVITYLEYDGIYAEKSGNSVKLYAGTYNFYYNYAKRGEDSGTSHGNAANRLWVDGTQTGGPADPNASQKWDAVSSSYGWVVGQFATRSMSAFDWNNGYRMSYDTSKSEYYITRLYLSKGDVFKVRAGDYYSSGCAWIRGGTNITASTYMKYDGSSNIEVLIAGYYDFYVSNGQNIWIAYSAT